MLIRWAEKRLNLKQSLKLKVKLVKFKDLIKPLMVLIDLIKDLIEAKLSLKVNLVKIERIN
jgi:hypothetical protein